MLVRYELKDKMVAEAKEKANLEAQKSIEHARHQIESEKTTAISEIKKQVAELSVSIAEKIIKKDINTIKTLYKKILQNKKNIEEMSNKIISIAEKCGYDETREWLEDDSCFYDDVLLECCRNRKQGHIWSKEGRGRPRCIICDTEKTLIFS